MNREHEIYCYPKTYEFLKAAIDEGAHKKVPNTSKLSDWPKRRNIMVCYYASRATLGNIGKKYGISREGVRQNVVKGLKDLWNSCSDDLRKLYPLEDIPTSKPLSLEWRLSDSLRKGGVTVGVLKMLQEGKNLVQIQEEFPITAQVLSRVRVALRKQGIDVPHRVPRISGGDQLAQNLIGSQMEDSVIQGLLDQVTCPFLNHCRRKRDPLLLSLSEIVRELTSLHRPVRLRKLAEGLMQAGIPIGVVERRLDLEPDKITIQRYYIVISAHRERVKQAILEDGLLKQYEE